MRTIRTMLAGVLLLSACAGGSSSTTTAAPTTTAGGATTTTAAATTTTAATATTEATTTTAAAVPLTANADGSYTIDWSALGTVFYAPPATGSSDPRYHVHTVPAADGFFFSIEAYTVYGPGWTGQLGTFTIDCGANGICVHFDPDGPGPLPNLGADFGATGTIEFVQLEGGFEAIITDLAFSNGATITGPLTVTAG